MRKTWKLVYRSLEQYCLSNVGTYGVLEGWKRYRRDFESKAKIGWERRLSQLRKELKELIK
jgi:hypothetical protein